MLKRVKDYVSRLKSNLLKHAPGDRIIFLVVFFLLFLLLLTAETDFLSNLIVKTSNGQG